MSDKIKKTPKKMSRRKFLATTAVAGAAAGAIGFPAVGRVRAADTIKLKIQTAWDAGTLGYVKFQDFCKNVGEMSDGKLVVEGFPAGAIVGTFELFAAVKAGVFDGMHCFDVAWQFRWPNAASN